jgi:hypothetical protein
MRRSNTGIPERLLHLLLGGVDPKGLGTVGLVALQRRHFNLV